VNIYICDICRTANSAVRLQCQSCGTTPAAYSVLGVNSRVIETELGPHDIQVVRAHGCDRQENHRTVRVYLRTVPMDYYAS